MRIQAFTGETARIASHLLPDNASSLTNNIDFIRGTLKPIGQPLLVISNPFGTGSAPTVKTLYRSSAGKYIAWAGDVNVARSPTPDDGLERIYWTGESAPKMASVTNIIAGMGSAMMAFVPSGLTNTLGVPAPTAAISGTVSGSGTGTALARQYVYTWVTTYGEESAPSSPSAVISVQSGQTVSLTITSSTAPTNTTKVRIYRTDAAGDWRYLVELTYGTWAYSDTLDDVWLGEALATTGWVPPNAGLQGLKSGPNGVLCGFFGNTVCFSEPYAPYAWPVAYQFITDYPIVAVCANAGGWLVATTGTPYFIAGSWPGQMSMAKINQNQACVSATSMVDMGDYVIYAAPSGLVSARGMDVQLISRDAVTRDQWQGITPSTLKAYAWENRYIGFLSSGSGFMFYPEKGYFANIGYSYTAAALDWTTGNLLAYKAADGVVRQWNGGSADTLTWRSKRFSFEQPVNIGVVRLDADWGVSSPVYPATFNLYVDDAVSPTVTASIYDNTPARLPGGFRGNYFVAEIVSTHEIRSVSLGRDMSELMAS